ncbi:MAG: amphi-Trp domain-containing protein [Candidatus Eisenbacteria bacterium]|uniref:Amphi-Trp domain-containing protein n=1 Tax=Eiseniibacteriota bacterium TaxID=2212470 RepID=A0A956RNQ1_UNCEI|nr:amphi-Trp domain-containing protein [Candidatus Eisenbacteria bacterium]
MDELETTDEAMSDLEHDGENGKAEVKYESFLPLEEAVSYFEAIVNGMRNGAITITRGDTELHLRPQESIELAVKASRKKNKERISFEIEWRMPAKSDLHISAE